MFRIAKEEKRTRDDFLKPQKETMTSEKTTEQIFKITCSNLNKSQIFRSND